MGSTLAPLPPTTHNIHPTNQPPFPSFFPPATDRPIVNQKKKKKNEIKINFFCTVPALGPVDPRILPASPPSPSLPSLPP